VALAIVKATAREELACITTVGRVTRTAGIPT